MNESATFTLSTRNPVRVDADHAIRYPGADKLATECVVNLIRAGSLTTTAVGVHFRRHGISGAAFNLLMILRGAGRPLSPHEIGERQLVTRGTVTGLLDTVEKQGFVRRLPHPDDRRMLLVEITDTGRELLDAVCVELFPAQAQMLSALSAADKEALVQLLGAVQDSLSASA